MLNVMTMRVWQNAGQVTTDYERRRDISSIEVVARQELKAQGSWILSGIGL